MPVAPPALPFSTEPRPRMRWWPLILLALLKLVLVSHDEIRTVSADDSGYARFAAAWYWGSDYGPYAYCRQPLYPLFISVSQVFGVPYRVWMELTWIAACIVSARALNAAGVRRGLALFACAVMLFHPTTLTLFPRLLPDGLYTAGWMVLVTSLAAAITQHSIRATTRWASAAALGAMIAANARPESILVWGVLALGGVIIILTSLVGWARDSRLWRPLGVCLLLPFAVTQVMTQSFAAANEARIGVRVTYDLNMPGFVSLYQALLSIPPDEPMLLLPIPRDVRDRAYAASPTFRRLEPFLDGDKRIADYATACFKQTGVEGEYGGWTVWALRRATWEMKNTWTNAAELDAFYAQCADELRQAARDGRLESRAVPLPFVPPEWGLLAAELPASVQHCWKSLVKIGGAPIAEEEVHPDFPPLFDAAAGRRTTLKALNRGEFVEASVWHRRDVHERLQVIERGITNVGRNAVMLAPVVALVGTLVVFLCPSRHPRHWSHRRRGIAVLLLMLWGAGLARLLFIAVLDANAISSQQRYMFPAGILMLALVPVALAGVFESIRDLMARRDSPESNTPPGPAAAPGASG